MEKGKGVINIYNMFMTSMMIMISADADADNDDDDDGRAGGYSCTNPY